MALSKQTLSFLHRPLELKCRTEADGFHEIRRFAREYTIRGMQAITPFVAFGVSADQLGAVRFQQLDEILSY